MRTLVKFFSVAVMLLMFAGTVHAEILGFIPAYTDPLGSMTDLDNWQAQAGKRASVVSTSMDTVSAFDSAYVESIWTHGYTPFIFLNVSQSASNINAGNADGQIHAWGSAFAAWANSPGGRRAMIAPLEEMNISRDYGPPATPAEGKAAYVRVQRIIQSELALAGVNHNAVAWAFEPNGWSAVGYEFEKYYPGAAYADMIGISGYNFGTCGFGWDAYDAAVGQYLNRLSVMDPSKPIIVVTGTVQQGGVLGNDKNDWLKTLYVRFHTLARPFMVLYQTTKRRNWPTAVRLGQITAFTSRARPCGRATSRR